MNKLIEIFNKTFSHWHITIPPDDVEQHRSGKICKGGWTVWYLSGANKKGEYLDYYACHRMTNDRHVKIYANGKYRCLPAIADFRIASEDPAEDARLEAEYQIKTQRIVKLLKSKGLRP